MSKTYDYTFRISNRMKGGTDKVFVITPALSVYHDHSPDFPWIQWAIYFEWLWFQICLSVDIQDEAAEKQLEKEKA